MGTTSAAGRYAGQAQLDTAVSGFWQAVRGTHSELPELAPAINARYPAEPLPATASKVAASILREAVHELADVHEASVVSRGGRYHNKLFRTYAAELGLQADEDGTRGWAAVSLPEETAQRYAAELDAIDRVLAEHPVPAEVRPPKRAGQKADSGARVAAVCQCTPPNRIWLFRSLLEQQIVSCTKCAREGRDPFFVDPAATAQP